MSVLGKMRHRVALQSATNTTDAGGGLAQVWETITHIYASIEPKNGSESYR
jgi:head-tail adaptor